MVEENREKKLWREIDRLAFWLSTISIILLTTSYFLIVSFLTDFPTIRNFLAGLITNLIPVCLLFALSYIFFRRIQNIRSEKDIETLTKQIAKVINSSLTEKLLNKLNTEVHTDLTDVKELLNKSTSRENTEILTKKITEAVNSSLTEELLNKLKIEIHADLTDIKELLNKSTSRENTEILTKKITETVSSSITNSLLDKPKQKKVKILFVCANPIDTKRLGLTSEAKRIKNSLQNAKFHKNFELIQEFGVCKRDLQACLLKYQPNILHFSGYIEDTGIILENSQGESEVVSKQEFCTLISNLKSNPQLVFLNAGSDSNLGHELSKEIDFVITPADELDDTEAIEFPAALYNAIGNNMDIKTAHQLASSQLKYAEYTLFEPETDSPKYLLPGLSGLLRGK